MFNFFKKEYTVTLENREAMIYAIDSYLHVSKFFGVSFRKLN